MTNIKEKTNRKMKKAMHCMRHKKGYLFLLTLSFFLLLMLGAKSLDQQSSYQQQTSQLSHLFHLDQQFHFLEEDLSRGLYIITFRSLLALLDWINQNGTYLDNSTEAFYEAMINGSYQGEVLPLMNQTTLPFFLTKLQQRAAENGFTFLVNLTNFSVFQQDPWHITSQATFSLVFYEHLSDALWQRNLTIQRLIPLEEVEDPLYTVETQGLIINQIFPTSFVSFVQGNNTTNLSIHTNYSWYLASTTAPSFLQRMEGNMQSSPYGIESLVNLDRFIAQGLAIKNTSVVDYLYFSNRLLQNISHIQTMPSWFYLDGDDNHFQTYQVESLRE